MVTAAHPLNSIGYVGSRTAQASPAVMLPRASRDTLAGNAGAGAMLLTKRRAVDFCRVATAMCPRPVPRVA